jgi:hypothetical protein
LAIVILFLRQNKLLHVDEQQKNNIKELEELISGYLLEMKDENEHFIRKVRNLNEEKILSTSNKAKYVSLVDEVAGQANVENSQKQPDSSRKVAKITTYHAVKAYQQNQLQGEKVAPSKTNKQKVIDGAQISSPSLEQKTEERYEQTIQGLLVGQLLAMKQKGMSIDEMAKKMNKGKSEIELLLKFRENMKE